MLSGYFASGCLMKREEDGKWSEEIVNIDSIDDILDIFSPYQMYVEQVDLDKYRKVYYTVENLASQGVVAKIEDADGVLHFMASPLLLVQCNDKEPIKIESSVKDSIVNELKLY